MTITEVRIGEARARRLAVDAMGRVWIADYDGGRLGVHDPAKNETRFFPGPGGARSQPYGGPSTTPLPRPGWQPENLPQMFRSR